MTSESEADHTTDAKPDSEIPVSWDIRGFQNKWNWKLAPDANDIVYQTRFLAPDFAMVYQGAETSSTLLAGIKFAMDSWQADITFFAAPLDSNNTITSDFTTMKNIANMIRWGRFTALKKMYDIAYTVRMENTAEETFSNRWPVNIRALGGRELHWEFEHSVDGCNCIYLTDPATEKTLGDAQGNYLALHEVFQKEAVTELAITGTAAMVLLSGFMQNDLSIATQGPNGLDNWKYQELNRR
jgi:hypothetical protein